MTALHDPGGNGFRIETVWAFLAIHDDDDEGVMGASINGTLMPLIAADEQRIEILRPYAEAAAKLSGKTIMLAKFERRVDVETITP